MILALAVGVCSTMMAKVTMSSGKPEGDMFDGYVSYHKDETTITRFYKKGRDKKGNEIIVHAYDEYKLIIANHVAMVPKREAKRIFLELEAAYDDQTTIALSKHHAYRAKKHAQHKEKTADYVPLAPFDMEMGDRPVQRSFFQIIRDICVDCTGCNTGKKQ